AIIGDDNSVTGGLLGAATLLAVNALVVRFLYSHERLDRLVEGEADVLVENGKIRLERLKAELITLPELESAAHKQGFASLDEVDRAVLEPGGTISFIGKKPGPEAVRPGEERSSSSCCSSCPRGRAATSPCAGRSRRRASWWRPRAAPAWSPRTRRSSSPRSTA